MIPMLTLFLILLSLVWFAVSVVVIAACRMAARGDGEVGLGGDWRLRAPAGRARGGRCAAGS